MLDFYSAQHWPSRQTVGARGVRALASLALGLSLTVMLLAVLGGVVSPAPVVYAATPSRTPTGTQLAPQQKLYLPLIQS